MDDNVRIYGREDGFKDIAVTGTPVPLSTTSIRFKKLRVRAKDANAANIFIGGAGVDATKGDALFGTQSIDFEAGDLSSIYINGTAPEGVTFHYEY